MLCYSKGTANISRLNMEVPKHGNHNTKRSHKIQAEKSCTSSSCFFCIMNEPNPSRRRARIAKFFKGIPLRNDSEHVLALSSLWNIAMTQPDDPEFPSLGVFGCMAKMIKRGINDQEWLLRDQNIYIPYYAAHIIGSYVMNKAEFAEKAVKSGVILPLMGLMRGKISWVEQRVAVRALGHIASHEKTFQDIAVYEQEVIETAMAIASNCVEEVYHKFIAVKSAKRRKYHRDLLTRGLGGFEMECGKAEEWSSQLQCWSLYLLSCFTGKGRGLDLVCKKEFLISSCKIWGGLVNEASFSGVGLIRTLCCTNTGRKHVSLCNEVLETLCNVSRSSDHWQFMAIDCLVSLLKDLDTRYLVMDKVVHCLIDLVELHKRAGDTITQVLLQDYHKVKYGDLRFNSEKSHKALQDTWDLKVERRKKERLMSRQEVKERKVKVGLLKRQGNCKFWSGDVKRALEKYTKALDLCPLKMRRERVVLYSNRAQCHLLMNNPDRAISDATRAISLSSAVKVHYKSLWRRSQAYDMKALARESLMDGLMFLSARMKSEQSREGKIPYYAARMINRQMSATWLFSSVKSERRHLN